MSANNREVDQATAALCAEMMKLSTLDDQANAILSVTIDNALSRFAEAILAQAQNTPELCPTTAVPAEV